MLAFTGRNIFNSIAHQRSSQKFFYHLRCLFGLRPYMSTISQSIWCFSSFNCIVATQIRSRMATKFGRSNGSFHRVLACSAGGPGLDSRLRHNTLRCSMHKDVDGSGQASTVYYYYKRAVCLLQYRKENKVCYRFFCCT